ncbi:MAG TPA: FAD-binding oxidoreductase [Acidimicrobiales bacterium]|nr:FAD-binding oxidoreductase [Acidimicrobiales bacterium]
MTRRSLTGWGRTSPTRAEVVAATDSVVVVNALNGAGRRGILPRGLGRAYGDAAQNAGGTVLSVTSLGGSITIDHQGVATVSAATTIDDLIRAALPQGWFVPVTPGTRQVTIGGAVAADIHGKNHHVDGSLMSHVRRLTLITPTGTRRLMPSDPLFWATAGGMGLTGVVVSAEVVLTPVTTSRMAVDTDRTADLEETLAVMSDGDDRFRYSVCWIDCLSRGRRLGRSIVTRGDHAEVGALPAGAVRDPLAFTPRRPLPAPPWAPSGLLNVATITAFNEAWYRRAPRHERGAIQSIGQFFHPLDGIEGWNRAYGRRGFLQWQILIPFGSEPTLRRIIERLASARCPSFVGVLKRFGPGNDGHLSFPGPGWTLALDMPVGPAALGPLLDELDEAVVSAGGRIYLAKDSRLRPELIEAMYPRLPEWRQVRSAADPHGVMNSDLARRLGLLEAHGSTRSGHQGRPARAGA